MDVIAPNLFHSLLDWYVATADDGTFTVTLALTTPWNGELANDGGVVA